VGIDSRGAGTVAIYHRDWKNQAGNPITELVFQECYNQFGKYDRSLLEQTLAHLDAERFRIRINKN